MRVRRHPRTVTVLVLALGAAAAAAAWYGLRPGMAVEPAAPLAAHVRARPPVGVVFTSRTEASALDAAAPEADPYRAPGAVPWAAREGRLRLLDPAGRVYELTWGRPLPDGGTLVDVMSPSVSLDGRRVLFAGRRADGHGRWRVYETGVDGAGLRPLTGGPDDPGCVALPPLRFRADGSRLADAERRTTDYDDVDPTDLGPNGFAFASSRLPDLGRDHSRRATQIWAWPPGAAAPGALTANRNNDRWPVLLASEQVLFSAWSRNREAVAADLSGVRPVADGGEFATRPTDNWMAAAVATNAAQFGYAVKSTEPVWRPRPLFNGRVAFMTRAAGDARLRLAQADWGYIRTAPSSLSAGEALPYEGGAVMTFGPVRDAAGQELVAGSPSAAPGGRVLFAAAPAGAPAAAFGLYAVPDDWTAGRLTPEPLFDDPDFAAAEPGAVYPRRSVPEPKALAPPPADGYSRPTAVVLADGTSHTGPVGYLENLAIGAAIRNPIPWHAVRPGERIDPRQNPLVSPPPNVAAVAAYAAGRDRFDHPEHVRIPGGWEKLCVLPVREGNDLSGWVPSDPLRPVVLVGLDAAGKVARWAGTGGGDGRARTYFAYAGDHYSGVRPNGYHYCNGCHAGHTFTVLDATERTGSRR